MFRKLTRATLALNLALLMQTLAFAGTVTLRGRVINGTNEGRPVPNLEVVLYRSTADQQQPAEGGRAVTDASGRFRFGDLPGAPGVAYYPMVNYQGVEYYGEVVRPDSQTKVLESNVLVYEAGKDSSAIHVEMEHLILEPARGNLLVKDIFVVRNAGRTTYTGTKEVEPGKFATLAFRLPEGYTSLSVAGDLMSCCAVVLGNIVYDTMPVKPGFRQEVLTYQVPYDGTALTLRKVALDSTALLDIFVPNTGIGISGEGLNDQGEFRIRGQSYRRYTLEGIRAGSELELQLTNLPPAPKNAKRLALLAVGLAAALVFAFVTIRRRRATKGQPEEQHFSVVEQREKLIDAIADLDERFEAGEVDEEDYRRTRQALKQKVLEIDAAFGKGE